MVQVEGDDGQVQEFQTRDEVHEAIWNEVHRKRFFLPEEAPTFQGWLCGEFGYSEVSPMARAVLDGSFEYPADMDKATKEIGKQAAKICNRIPRNSAEYVITREKWQERCKHAKEDT